MGQASRWRINQEEGWGRPQATSSQKALHRKILGIDPSLRGTGLAILECEGSTYRLLHSETLKLGTKVASVCCLGKIHEQVAHLVDLWQPRHVSCEETIYVQNFKTAQIMGAARGAALSAAAIRNIPVFEYAPLR